MDNTTPFGRMLSGTWEMLQCTVKVTVSRSQDQDHPQGVEAVEGRGEDLAIQRTYIDRGGFFKNGHSRHIKLAVGWGEGGYVHKP